MTKTTEQKERAKLIKKVCTEIKKEFKKMMMSEKDLIARIKRYNITDEVDFHRAKTGWKGEK